MQIGLKLLEQERERGTEKKTGLKKVQERLKSLGEREGAED